MKRKTVYAGLSFLAGLLMAEYLCTVLVICTTAVFAFVLIYTHLKKAYRECALICISFLFAFSYYKAYDSLAFDPLRRASGNTYSINGSIYQIDEINSDTCRYFIRGELSTGDNIKTYYYGDSKAVSLGDSVSLTAELSVIENTYAFSAADYYHSKGIVVTLIDPTDIIYTERNSIRSLFSESCERVRFFIRLNLPGETGNFLVSMLFGDSDSIDYNSRTMLYKAGIGHVMAASGLHLIIVTTFIAYLFSFVDSVHLRFLVTELSAAGFMICAGFSESVLRAFIMLSISAAAPLFARHTDNLNSLCLAVLLLTAFSPYTASDPSFLLSTSGAFAAGVFAPYMTDKLFVTKEDAPCPLMLRPIRSAVFMLFVSLAIFPASLLYFDEISLISPLSNLLLIPLCSVALVCALIIALTGCVSFIAFPLLAVAGVAVNLVLTCSRVLTQLSFAVFPVGAYYVFPLIMISALLVVLTYFIVKTRRSVAVVIATCVMTFSIASAAMDNVSEKNSYVACFTSKSLAIVLRSADDCIVIADSGDEIRSVEKYLTRFGVKTISALVFTNNAASAYSTYVNALESVDIQSVLICNRPAIADSLSGEPLDIQRCSFGEEITYGNWRITAHTVRDISIYHDSFSFRTINCYQTNGKTYNAALTVHCDESFAFNAQAVIDSEAYNATELELNADGRFRTHNLLTDEYNFLRR